MSARLRIACAAALWLALVGCAGAGHVAPAERAVPEVVVERAWRPATAADLEGLFASVEVSGPAAAVLREVHYWFGADGSFSGAALVVVPTPSFTTLSGRWRLTDGLLELGEGAAPATAEVADGLLRLSGDEGTVVLERRTLP